MSEWWKAARAAAKSFSDTFNGRPRPTAGRPDPRTATPLQQAFAAGATTGYPVTSKHEELGHDTSWNYVGIHTVAKMWALSSWCAYDTSRPVLKSHAADAPAESRTPLHDHPSLKLLDRPNPLMSRMQFLYIIGTHLRLTGGWLIWEVRDTTGKPAHLWPIPRSWTTWQRPDANRPLGYFRVYNPRGMQGYYGSSQIANGFELDVRDCIVGGWPHPQFPGEQISPLSACSKIIDIMEQADNAIWSSLLNAYHNGMILMLDTAKNGWVEEAKLREMVEKFKQAKGGPTNAGAIGVLQGVSSIERPSTPLAELGAVEIRNQNKDFGLGIQGVPSVATGIRSEVGSYSGDAATFNAFAEWGIQPDLDLFAGSLTMRWRRHFGDEYELEGSAKRMDDPTLDQKKADQIWAAVAAGKMPLNSWCAVMKLPPQPGGDVAQPPPQPAGPITQNFHGAAQGAGPLGDIGVDGGDGSDSAPDSDIDLDLDLPDEKASGFKRPELSRAGGRPFEANGKGH